MPSDDHPRPAFDVDSHEFWAFCQQHELRLQRCTSCGRFRHHPRPRCPSCHSPDFEWSPCSGRGRVHTFTVCHPPVLGAFEDRVPYNVVVVELAEGPLMVSNLIDVDNDDLRVGLDVEVCFIDIDGEFTLPQFRLSSA
jgi:hypothetical protein